MGFDNDSPLKIQHASLGLENGAEFPYTPLKRQGLAKKTAHILFDTETYNHTRWDDDQLNLASGQRLLPVYGYEIIKILPCKL